MLMLWSSSVFNLRNHNHPHIRRASYLRKVAARSDQQNFSEPPIVPIQPKEFDEEEDEELEDRWFFEDFETDEDEDEDDDFAPLTLTNPARELKFREPLEMLRSSLGLSPLDKVNRDMLRNFFTDLINKQLSFDIELGSPVLKTPEMHESSHLGLELANILLFTQPGQIETEEQRTVSSYLMGHVLERWTTDPKKFAQLTEMVLLSQEI